jgi:hypothetical protein
LKHSDNRTRTPAPSETDHQTSQISPKRWGLMTRISLCVPVALILVPLLALIDGDRAKNHEALKNMEFGLPFGWLHQDQRLWDPQSYPYRATPTGPWNTATQVNSGMFLLDVVVLTVVLLGALELRHRAAQRRRPT